MTDHDTEAVMEASTEIRMTGKEDYRCALFETGCYEYFGEDIVGKTTGRKLSNLSAILAIIHGEGKAGAYEHQFKHKKDELVAEVEDALEAAGFEDYDIGKTNIGPMLPIALAMLRETHEVDLREAVEEHGGIVEYDWEDPEEDALIPAFTRVEDED